MRKTLVQTLLAAFCAILLTPLALGGGGMIIGARTAAWAAFKAFIASAGYEDDFAADLMGKQVAISAVQDIIADDVIPVTGDTSLTKTIATIGGKAIKAPEGGGKIIFPARQFEVC